MLWALGLQPCGRDADLAPRRLLSMRESDSKQVKLIFFFFNDVNFHIARCSEVKKA